MLDGLDDRDVRAEVIAALLLGIQDPVAGRAAALRLRGARVTGVLDLRSVDITAAVSLHQCEFDEIVTLAGTIPGVGFHDCRLRGIDARGARIDGSLSLHSSRIDGALVLSGASVNGELDLRCMELISRDGVAISARRLTVAGNLLACDLSAEGRLDLAGAAIAGTLDFSRSCVRDRTGQAVAAERISVGDHLDFTGFSSLGQVMLRGGRIDGQVLFGGAQLVNPGRYALHASALTVGDSVFLWRGFTVDGEIVLRRTRVNGALVFEPTGPIVLDASGLTADSISVRVDDPHTAAVDLRLTRTRKLSGDTEHWPGKSRLDGLLYETLDPHLPAEKRLAWLRRDEDGYVPQPYEQLAAVYRQIGHDIDARHVLLAKQRLRRNTLSPIGRIWGYIQDWMVGYGYQPARALTWLLTLLCIGTVVFSISPPRPMHIGETPHFSSFIYALDLLLPIVNFGQQSAWSPEGADQWLAYFLVAAGWLLATSVAAGVTHAVTRS